MGEEDLYESISLDGVQVFIKYDIKDKQIKIVNRITADPYSYPSKS